jgi:hypothetical protein
MRFGFVRHHEAQAVGRAEILHDYHLRVGQITQDTQLPEGHVLAEQRLDGTEVGSGTTATLIDARRMSDEVGTASLDARAHWLSYSPEADGLVAWDVFGAILTPGDLVLLLSWRDRRAAELFEEAVVLPDIGRLRRVRVVRDYGMFDRREAPQYYPDAPGAKSIHA